MNFENPVMKRLRALKQPLETTNRKIEPNNEQIISIDQIMDSNDDKKAVEIEYIDHPKFAVLTGSPRGMEFNTNELGVLSIKSDNKSLDESQKLM